MWQLLAETGTGRHIIMMHFGLRGLPKDWRRRPGRPRRTWLRTLEADLQPLNHGLNSGDSLRTEDDGSNSWKRLRSSQGHARDDDDDDFGNGDKPNGKGNEVIEMGKNPFPHISSVDCCKTGYPLGKLGNAREHDSCWELTGTWGNVKGTILSWKSA